MGGSRAEGAEATPNQGGTAENRASAKIGSFLPFLRAEGRAEAGRKGAVKRKNQRKARARSLALARPRSNPRAKWSKS